MTLCNFFFFNSNGRGDEERKNAACSNFENSIKKKPIKPGVIPNPWAMTVQT